MHGIKTLPCTNLPERECKMQQYISPQLNNLNTVCDVAYDVAYDVTVTTYDVQPRTYDIAYNEDHMPSYLDVRPVGFDDIVCTSHDTTSVGYHRCRVSTS